MTGGGFASDYERLRSRVLEGAVSDGHFGLVILLREGVAAWMTHASARPATVMRTYAEDRPSASTRIADNVHADMIVVLASMVMTTHEETCA
jgi:hypothetical protein